MPKDKDKEPVEQEETLDVTSEAAQPVEFAEIEPEIQENKSEPVEESSPAGAEEDIELASFSEAVSTDESANAADSDAPVTVQAVKFASFEDQNQAQGEANKNLDILMDIKLQLTVELGRTELPIKKVLELTRGSIIELEKVAGEPVELYANGKLVAHGEVVVIEDNFGLRITSITEPEDRLKGIQ